MNIVTSCSLCQVKISETAEKYIRLYFICTTKENRKTQAAREFLNKNYKSFRREIVDIGVDTLYACDFSKEAQKAIQEYYRFAVAKLFIHIVVVSNETIFIDKNC